MSWIHSYSKEDFTLYTRCAAEYDFAYHTVRRMEWRLDDFLSEGLIPATESTLAARSREIKETLDAIPDRQTLPSALRQLLDVPEKKARRYLDDVEKNTTSKLVQLRLGESILTAEVTREDDSPLTILAARHQAEHMSDDDLYFLSTSILGRVTSITDDIEEAQLNSDFFKQVNNVRHFRNRIDKLVKSCELHDDDIRTWLEMWASHITFASGRGRNPDQGEWLVGWRETFVCIKDIADNLHRLLILAEATAHEDWSSNKQGVWLKQLEDRFQKDNNRLRSLLLWLVKAILSAFTTPKTGDFFLARALRLLT
ncbi:hypothetical protein N9435_10380 [Pseudomonadales bacterium]|nr:hypothetical protein [Pseudomonadales bacterium]